MDKQLYSYHLPSHLIAKEPARARDESRLFIYDTHTGRIFLDVFRNLVEHLPKKSVVVMNDVSVVPARMTLSKQTGGNVVCLFLVNEKTNGTEVRVMVDRKVSVGDTLSYGHQPIATVAAHSEASVFVVRLFMTRNELIDFLHLHGSTPIPLYLRDTPLPEQTLKDRYQTIFSQNDTTMGAAAAPTASLHITPGVLRSLQRKNSTAAFISLFVGLGTFAPLTQQQLDRNILHEEWYDIPKKTLEVVKSTTDIVAVGTTVVRALESYGKTHQATGSTRIFIHPPFPFRYVKHLVTNFHLPDSSLMMLVEAFLQHKQAPHHLIELYRMAITERFRFYSFGDAMLIL